MQTVTFSRPRVAFNLVAIPFTAVAHMFRAAVSAVSIAWSDVKEGVSAEFHLGVRYVLTGSIHDTAIADQRQAVVAATKDKAVSAVESFKAFLERHVTHRALGVILFLAIPLLLAWVLVEEMIFQIVKSNLVGDVVDAYRTAFKAIRTGERFSF